MKGKLVKGDKLWKNGILARAIRKEIYKEDDFRDKSYQSIKTGQSVVNSTIVPSYTITSDTKRLNYQATKKKYNKSKLEKEKSL